MFGTTLLVTVVLLVLASAYLKKTAVQDLAEDHAREVAQLAFHSIYLVMGQGGTKKDMDAAIAKLKALINEGSIRIITNYPEDYTYPNDKTPRGTEIDPAAFQVFLTGTEQLSIKEHAIRYLYPIKIGDRCVSCHTSASPGDISGVIEIVQPIEKLKVPLDLTVKLLIGFSVFLLIALLITMHANLRLFLITPLTRLVGIIKGAVRDTDLSRRVNPDSRVQEIGELSESFNELLSSIQSYNVKVNRLTHNDPLTRLYNRRKFEDCIKSEIEYFKTSKESFSIIFLNIDRFHHINDANGHPFGDKVLKKVTMILMNHVRDRGIVARTGGDEFAAVLPRTPGEEAVALAEGLCRALSVTEIDSQRGPIWLSASFGVVTYPDHGRSVAELTVAGDVAVHKAKEAGRNRVVTVDPAEVHNISERFGRKAWIQKAIREGHMTLFTQPIIEVNSKRVFGYEVLTRVRNGDELLSADTFIADLERHGIEEFDQFVIESALKYKQQSPSLGGVKLFVNLSAASIQNQQFMLGLPDLLDTQGIPSGELVIEITEREALRHLSSLSTLMRKLKNRGILFALDDFGSGFNSFLYLRHFPVDYVKIEGSFVQNMVANGRDRQLVKHIQLVTKALGVKAIAEWVEDENIHQLVAKFGISLAQGYYYGDPTERYEPDVLRSNIA